MLPLRVAPYGPPPSTGLSHPVVQLAKMVQQCLAYLVRHRHEVHVDGVTRSDANVESYGQAFHESEVTLFAAGRLDGLSSKTQRIAVHAGGRTRFPGLPLLVGVWRSTQRSGSTCAVLRRRAIRSTPCGW